MIGVGCPQAVLRSVYTLATTPTKTYLEDERIHCLAPVIKTWKQLNRARPMDLAPIHLGNRANAGNDLLPSPRRIRDSCPKPTIEVSKPTIYFN